jgi:hypothetical protein
VTKLDRDATYRVRGWSGIAFRIVDFPKTWEPWTTIYIDEDGEEQEEDTGEGEWEEQNESCGRVIVRMVGDDGEHEVDVEDLTPLADNDYCHDCGQTGCTATQIP